MSVNKEIKYLEFCVNQWEWIAEVLSIHCDDECRLHIGALKAEYVEHIASNGPHSKLNMLQEIKGRHNCALCVLYQDDDTEEDDYNCDSCKLLPLWNLHRKPEFEYLTYAACELSTSPYRKIREITRGRPWEYYDAVFFALLIAEEARNAIDKINCFRQCM